MPALAAKIAREKLTFTNARGQQLAAALERPNDRLSRPRAFAVFAHCFTCSKDIAAASRVSRALVQRGLSVLRFDFTGIGASEGDFGNTDFSSNVDDLVAAADFLREHHDAPRILVGHSLGGAAVLAAASQVPEARAIATIGAPSDPAHVTQLFGGELARIAEDGRATVTLGGREFPITREFLADVSAQRLTEHVKSLGKALLVMHSPIDSVVGVDHARRIYEAAKHPKSFVSLDSADHLLSRRGDSIYVAGVLAAWASRYLPEAADADVAPTAPPEGTVRVTETGGGYRNAIVAREHRIIADEPSSAGGTDDGMTPYELLLAALGACTSMTLRMYAARKGWDVGAISVDVGQRRVHVEDSGDCDDTQHMIDEITRHIRVDATLDDTQRKRLEYIAGRCPVHRTLVEDKRITTELSTPTTSE